MSRPLNALLIGVGMVADMHAKAIKATQGRVALAAVHARRREPAEAFASRHGVARVLESLDHATDLNDIDFAILTTPPDARLALAQPLIDHGIPLLVEKPVARNLSEARELVELCDKARLPLGIVLQHRMRAAAQTLSEHLASGDLGTIASAELRVPWWRDQSYYDAPGRGSYARDGGGVLITQAIHSLDLLLQFCGPVAGVQAMTSTTPLHSLEAEDFAGALLQFQSGAIGSVMASVTHFPGGAEEIILNGTRGSARLSSDHLQIALHSGKNEEYGANAATGGGADPMAFSHAWHQAVIEDFADALQSRRDPTITGRSALAVHAVIDAINRSAKTGQRITVEASDD